MKRWARRRRRARIRPRPGPTRRDSRTRGTTRPIRCGASVRTGRSSGGATWCLSAKRCAGNSSGWRKPSAGDWTVRFMQVELGRIDRQTRKFTRGVARPAARMTPRPQPWKCRPRGHHKSLPTGTWKSRREIPTFPPLIVVTADEMDRIRKSVTDVSGLICYRCFRLHRGRREEVGGRRGRRRSD